MPAHREKKVKGKAMNFSTEIQWYTVSEAKRWSKWSVFVMQFSIYAPEL